MAKRIVRLNERELTQLIKSVILEQPAAPAAPTGTDSEKCVKQTSQPNCSEFELAKTIGGKIFNTDGRVVMMVMENGCPKLCRVNDKELYKLS